MVLIHTHAHMHTHTHTHAHTVEASVEYKVVVQALRLNTLSKLTFADGKRFDNLLKDVFQGVRFQEVKYEQLEQALRDSCIDCNLMVIESQVIKSVTERK